VHIEDNAGKDAKTMKLKFPQLRLRPSVNGITISQRVYVKEKGKYERTLLV
jgi:hypothetical protein